MKSIALRALALFCFVALSCEEDAISVDLVFEEAEVVGRDTSFWACGGGWYIATERDTFEVWDIPNLEIQGLLEVSQLDVSPPLKVFVAFDNTPTSTYATQFADRIKEVSAIELREE